MFSRFIYVVICIIFHSFLGLNNIRDTKRTFHAKIGTIKDRNNMDLTEEEDVKKRWQEYTEELYKEDLMTQITMSV